MYSMVVHSGYWEWSLVAILGFFLDGPGLLASASLASWPSKGWTGSDAAGAEAWLSSLAGTWDSFANPMASGPVPTPRITHLVPLDGSSTKKKYFARQAGHEAVLRGFLAPALHAGKQLPKPPWCKQFPVWGLTLVSATFSCLPTKN
jgi:hypothetical protein